MCKANIILIEIIEFIIEIDKLSNSLRIIETRVK